MREPGASEVLICGCTTSPAATAFLASSPAASNTAGLEVLVQLVMAAISTSPLPTVMPRSPLPALLPCAPSRRSATRWCSSPAGRLKPLCASGWLNSRANWRLTWPSSMRSCGRLGPARLGATLPRAGWTTREWARSAGHGAPKQPLGLEVGLKDFDLVLAATRALEVGDGFFVDRKEAHRGAVLGRHVGDGGAVGQRQRARAGAEELDELAHHLVLAQQFG